MGRPAIDWESKRHQLFECWRANMTTEQMAQALGVSRSAFYRGVRELGVQIIYEDVRCKWDWSGNMKKQIQEWGAAGMTISEMAAKLKTSQSYLSQMIKKHRIFSNRNEYGYGRRAVLAKAHKRFNIIVTVEEFSAHDPDNPKRSTKQGDQVTPEWLSQFANWYKSVLDMQRIQVENPTRGTDGTDVSSSQ